MPTKKIKDILSEALAGRYEYGFLRHFLDNAAGGEYFTSLNLHLAGVLQLQEVRCEPPVYGNGPRVSFQPPKGRREVFNPLRIADQWKEIAVFALQKGVPLAAKGRNELLVPVIVMDAVARATGWKGVGHE